MTEGDILRRLASLETEIARIRDTYPTDAVVQAQLAGIRQEVAQLRTEIGRLDTRTDGLSGRIDRLRQAWSDESRATKNKLVALLGTVAAGVIVAWVASVIGG